MTKTNLARAESAQSPDNGVLDETLLDIAVTIELSPHDRQLAENRYRRLKEHVERRESRLKPYLVDGQSLIYAQGSIATSSTIVTGDNDDRFDVDAIVEVDVPADWDDQEPLDQLFATLQGFPGAIEIVRCTRCVQIRFASMHMDVTVMDRAARIAGDRPGQIFHSPDQGEAYRVASNPWGFTKWFRAKVGNSQSAFQKRLGFARDSARVQRLSALDDAEALVMLKAEQVPLPPAIPCLVDAQEVVALKLLKRFLNLRYAGTGLKRPPSIWLTKLCADIGFDPRGLSCQLFTVAAIIASILRDHLLMQTVPTDRNPSYHPDRLNDRWPRPWPEAKSDMTYLADQLDYLCECLNTLASAAQGAVLEQMERLFGERPGKAAREMLKKRYDRRSSGESLLIVPGSGKVHSQHQVGTRNSEPIPSHRFHTVKLK